VTTEKPYIRFSTPSSPYRSRIEEIFLRSEAMINTTKDLIPLRGTFTDENGAPMPTPGPDDCFPICGGQWPGSFQGAVQARCSSCGGFVALSTNGRTLHLQNRAGRPIFCSECFVAIVKEMVKIQTPEAKP
jgi:hypothetical protein